MLRHIEQLRPLLQDNADIIAVMQAGFIGPWGEWHNSTNGLETDAAMQSIAQGLLSSLPASRCIQLRTPRYKRAILGNDLPLELTDAFNGTPQARLGHHNDCFLADESDLGTYDTARLAWDKQYLASDTKYVPMGGETCSPSSFTQSNYARAELERMHWSYLNYEFHPKVIADWEKSGLLSDANKYLGYRLALLASSCDSSVAAGSSWSISLNIENLGWAAPFNPHEVNLVLERSDKSQAYEVALDADLRQWLPGKPHLIRRTVGIPEEVTAGEYKLYLRLLDPEQRLRSRPEYMIQLANSGLWDAPTASHDLRQMVVIKESPSGDPYRGESWFKPCTPLTSNQQPTD